MSVRDAGGRIARAGLRRLPLVGTLAGLGLAAWLVTVNDLSAVGAAFARIGFVGLAGVVAVRVGVLLLCGLAWARLLRGLVPIGLAPFLVLRLVREGINVLLPVASVGGDMVGGRLLTFWKVTGAFAAASILVDMLMQVGSQAVFALLGVVLLAQVEGEAARDLAAWCQRALAVAGIVLAAFFAFQRTGAARFIERGAADLVRRFQRDAGTGARADGGVQPALDAVWARLGRPLQCFLLHVAAWLLGAAEIWIALACLGLGSVGLIEVLVLESLTQAMKSAAFPVPSGLGVQEGAFVVVGGLFGLDPGTALALSLVKRVPDVVLGLPALMAWQAIEARRATLLPQH